MPFIKVQGSSCILAVLVWFMTLLTSHAADPATWRVWLEPKFMRAPVSTPVAQSERTEIASGVLRDEELQTLSKAEWEGLGVTWVEFNQRAQMNATADLAELKPEYIRNRRKVIEYAVLRSERPIVATAVLAPRFLQLFQDTLGPKVLVAIPNRYTAYVFPALASNYPDYAPMIFRDYRGTPFPVSVEVFEFSPEGIKTVGAYEEP